MFIVSSIINAISRAMLLVSCFTLTAMMVVVLAEVVTRALFGFTAGEIDFTFTGGIELVSFTLLLTILYALPWNLDVSQVVVDLFTTNLSKRAVAFLEAICFTGYFLLALAMSYRFWISIGQAHLSGETTQDLGIPMTYIYAATLVATGMLCLRSLLFVGKKVREVMGYQS